MTHWDDLLSGISDNIDKQKSNLENIEKREELLLDALKDPFVKENEVHTHLGEILLVKNSTIDKIFHLERVLQIERTVDGYETLAREQDISIEKIPSVRIIKPQLIGNETKVPTPLTNIKKEKTLEFKSPISGMKLFGEILVFIQPSKVIEINVKTGIQVEYPRKLGLYASDIHTLGFIAHFDGPFICIENYREPGVPEQRIPVLPGMRSFEFFEEDKILFLSDRKGICCTNLRGDKLWEYTRGSTVRYLSVTARNEIFVRFDKNVGIILSKEGKILQEKLKLYEPIFLSDGSIIDGKFHLIELIDGEITRYKSEITGGYGILEFENQIIKDCGTSITFYSRN
jgi:hypothetical protein